MSFVRTRRPERWDQWRVALHLYDGRACPECGAIIVGRPDRRTHREWHRLRTEWDTLAREAIRRALVAAGLNPVELAEVVMPEDEYGLDDQLTVKARTVAQFDYDDEEDVEEDDGSDVY